MGHVSQAVEKSASHNPGRGALFGCKFLLQQIECLRRLTMPADIRRNVLTPSSNRSFFHFAAAARGSHALFTQHTRDGFARVFQRHPAGTETIYRKHDNPLERLAARARVSASAA